MIFDERAIEAAARLSYMARGYAREYKRWDDLPEPVKKDWHVVARNILQAALSSMNERGLVATASIENVRQVRPHLLDANIVIDTNSPDFLETVVLIAKVQP